MASDTSEAAYAVGPAAPQHATARGTWVLDDDLKAMQACYAHARAVVRAFREVDGAPKMVLWNIGETPVRALEALSQACGMGPLWGPP